LIEVTAWAGLIVSLYVKLQNTFWLLISDLLSNVIHMISNLGIHLSCYSKYITGNLNFQFDIILFYL